MMEKGIEEIKRDLERTLKKDYLRALVKLQCYLDEIKDEKVKEEAVKEFNLLLNQKSLNDKSVKKSIKKLERIYENLIRAIKEVNNGTSFKKLGDKILLLESFTEFLRRKLLEKSKNEGITFEEALRGYLRNFGFGIRAIGEETEIALRKASAITIIAMEIQGFVGRDTQAILIGFLVDLCKHNRKMFEKLLS
jgi:hypothetical protein